MGVDLETGEEVDRRRKTTDEKLRREVQVLLTDTTYVELLENARDDTGRPISLSEWVREAVYEKLDRLLPQDPPRARST